MYRRRLKVMDLTAFTMCKENDLPIVVFDMDTPGNLQKVIAGEPIERREKRLTSRRSLPGNPSGGMITKTRF